MQKIISYILNEILSTTNLRKAIPLFVVVFSGLISYQTFIIHKLQNTTSELNTKITHGTETLYLTVQDNNIKLIDHAGQVLTVWVDKMAENQKLIVEYSENINENNKDLIIRNIETSSETVKEKAEQEFQKIKQTRPRPVIKVRPANEKEDGRINQYFFDRNREAIPNKKIIIPKPYEKELFHG